MAPGKLKCTMFDGVETNDLMVELIIEGLDASQKIWEADGVKVLNFSTQTAGAIDTLPNKNDRTRKTGCLYGSLLQSWVGPDSAQSKFFAEGIAESTYAGQAELDGHACLILSWDRGVDDQGNRRVDRFWVDTSLYVLRRWDTLESTQHVPLTKTRSREYKNMRLGTIEAFRKLSDSDPTPSK